MHSGNAAAIPEARNAATLSFCHASSSVRITTAILVSNCIDSSRGCHFGKARKRGSRNFRPLEQDSARDAIASAFSVAGPCADHAFLAAELVAFTGRFVERTRNMRLD